MPSFVSTAVDNRGISSAGETKAATSDASLIDEFIRQQRDLTATARFSRWHERHQVTSATPGKAYRDLVPLRKPRRGEQYAFVVELDRCSGCKACVCACHSLNGLDEGEMWRSVGLLVGDDTESRQDASSTGAYQQHVTAACHHCQEPACAHGCPVLAYDKDPVTGIVRHLDDQCIGCQYCLLKCPYDVPKYSASKGIVRKCDMCHHRLAAGEAPACVQACPHEAIRIEVVETAAASVPNETSAQPLLPGTFSSHYTLPTTRYVSDRGIPADAIPADSNADRVEAAHTPLVVMLILTQLAAGLHVLTAALQLAGLTTGLKALHLFATTALMAGLAVSVFHLGRPLKAWRAFLGWRRSWMSREIIAFSAYAGLATAALIFNPTPLATVAALAGVVAVFCSAMIYIDTQRPTWNPITTLTRFFGTTLLLGATGGAAWASWISPNLATLLCVIATLVRTALFAWELHSLRSGLRNSSAPLHASARIATRRLPHLLNRRAMLFLASTVFSLFALFQVGTAMIWWSSAACITTLIGQSLDRHLFFVTANAPRMPGVGSDSRS